jgi:hypothetical protein
MPSLHNTKSGSSRTRCGKSASSTKSELKTGTGKGKGRDKAAASTSVGTGTGTSTKLGAGYSLNRKRDVYMLSYVKVDAYGSALDRPRCAPAVEVAEQVLEENARLRQAASEYCSRADTVEAQAADRRDAYTALVKQRQLAPRTANDPFVLVPRDWLRQWVTGEADAAHVAAATATAPPSPPATISAGGGVGGPVDLTSDNDAGTRPAAAAATTTTTTTTTTATTTGTGTGAGSDANWCVLFNSPIDYSSVLCSHGNALHPSSVCDVRAVTPHAYTVMTGCDVDDLPPPLTSVTFRCQECLDGMQYLRTEMVARKTDLELMLESVKRHSLK